MIELDRGERTGQGGRLKTPRGERRHVGIVDGHHWRLVVSATEPGTVEL